MLQTGTVYLGQKHHLIQIVLVLVIWICIEHCLYRV
nr:MAG TPA: hypothetical protein [Caudoviricetes sp.]